MVFTCSVCLRTDRKKNGRGMCKACYKRWHLLNNPEVAERAKKYHAEWQRKNKDKLNQKSREYCAKNKHKRQAYRRANQEKIAAYSKEYRQNHRAYFNAHEAGRRQRARNFYKKLNKSHKKQIQEFYKNCPPGYHVDHIVPLKGVNVSGLHVLWNLQYLPASENRKKSFLYENT